MDPRSLPDAPLFVLGLGTERCVRTCFGANDEPSPELELRFRPRGRRGGGEGPEQRSAEHVRLFADARKIRKSSGRVGRRDDAIDLRAAVGNELSKLPCLHRQLLPALLDAVSGFAHEQSG